MAGGKTIRLKRWSDTVSGKVGDILGSEQEQRDIVSYGLYVLASNIIGLAGVLIAAYLIGAFVPTLAMSIVLLILRPNAGGAHCSNSFNCSLFGYIIMPLFGYGAFWLSRYPLIVQVIFLIGSTFFGLTWIALKAPYFTQSKPKAEAKNKKLRIYSMVLAAAVFLVALGFWNMGWGAWAMGMTMGLFFQGLVLSPAGIKGTLSLDNFASRVISGKGGEPR